MQWTVESQPVGTEPAPLAELFPNGADVLSPRFFPLAAGTYVLKVTTTESPQLAGSTGSAPQPAVRSETVRVFVACGQSPQVVIAADDDDERVSAGSVSSPLTTGPGDDDFDESERGTGLTSAVWVLGGTVGLDAASGTTDPDSPPAALSYTWRLVDNPSLPRVRRPGTAAMGFSRAAVLQQAQPTQLDSLSALQTGPSRGLANMVPDGIGTYEARVTVSDGCSQPSQGSFRVEVVCPAGPSASVTAVEPILLQPGVDSMPESVTLQGIASLGVADESEAPSQFRRISSAWSVVKVPPGAPTPAPLPGAPPSVARGSRTTVFFAAGSSASFAPDRVGTYVFRFHVTDGCSVAEEDLIVTIAYTDTCSSDGGGGGDGDGGQCPPQVVIVRDSSVAVVEFDTLLEGMDSAAFSSSPALQLAFREIVASIVSEGLPEGERSSMSASNVTIDSIGPGSQAGGSARRLQQDQGTAVQYSVVLEGTAADSDVTEAVAGAVEASTVSGSLAARINADESFVDAGVTTTGASLQSAPKTSVVRNVVTTTENSDGGEGDGWTDGEFWAAAAICIIVGCVLVAGAAFVLVSRCRQDGAKAGGGRGEGAMGHGRGGSAGGSGSLPIASTSSTSSDGDAKSRLTFESPMGVGTRLRQLGTGGSSSSPPPQQQTATQRHAQLQSSMRGASRQQGGRNEQQLNPLQRARSGAAAASGFSG